MDNNHLKVESLEMLIKAVHDYQEELEQNCQILVNAANACDVAMGQDDIAKKHIKRLYDALEELKKTSAIVDAVAVSLMMEKNIAITVYED